MIIRIITSRIELVRRSRRLGWLYGPQPNYGEQLPWFHRLPLSDPELPPNGQICRNWLYGPQPNYAEQLTWRRRPSVEPEVQPDEIRRRGWHAGMTSAVVVVTDQTPWRRRQVAPVDAVDDVPSRPRVGWQPGMTRVDQIPWRRKPIQPEEPAIAFISAPMWDPAIRSGLKLLLRRRRMAMLGEGIEKS